MKIVEPKVRPVRHFSFPVQIFTLSKARNWGYAIGMFLVCMLFLYATAIVAGADRYGKYPDHFLVQHREVYYGFVVVLVAVLFLPAVYPKILSAGSILISADSVLIVQRGRKPFRMELSKRDIRSVSIEIPNTYSRAHIRSGSTLRLHDDREIAFDIVSTSIKDRQGMRLDAIVEAAFESEEAGGFSVT